MKRLSLIAFMALSVHAIAQTNTFPSSGNVGIGTTSPSSNLEVANSSGGVLSISTNKKNGSIASPLRPTIDFLGYENGNKARISATEGTYDTHGSQLSMFVNDGSSPTSLVERVTINMYGNVGIGTTSPQSPLHIKASTGYGSIRISPNSDNAESSMGFFSDAAGTTNSTAWIIGNSPWGNTGKFIIGNQVAGGPIITALQNGSVGIGTTNPAGKLDLVDSNQHLTFLLNQKLAGAWPATTDATTMTIQSSGISAGNLAFATGNSEVIRITASSNVGIGTTNPAYKLDVLGTIRAKEVLVNLDGGADFVFEKGYKLLPIEHVASYLQKNKHLPDIPSANEMVKNGVSMGDMQVKLLQKVEELTLYAIQQNKKIENQETDRKTLEKKYNALLEKVEMLTKQIEKK